MTNKARIYEKDILGYPIQYIVKEGRQYFWLSQIGKHVFYKTNSVGSFISMYISNYVKENEKEKIIIEGGAKCWFVSAKGIKTVFENENKLDEALKKKVLAALNYRDESNDKAKMIWVSIEKIFPNPLNPRRNARDGIEDMKLVLKQQGWREPLTVHQKGDIYVLESGHRRLQAAKELDIKEVPIFINENKTTDEKQMIKDLVMHQAARKDWSTYEWAKVIYETWVYLNKPTFKELEGLLAGYYEVSSIGNYIAIFETYDKEEIEHKIENRTYSVSALAQLSHWLRKFEQHKPEMCNKLGKDFVKNLMLQKLENRYMTSKDLQGDLFVAESTDKQMKEFLTTKHYTLSEAQESIGVRKTKGSNSNWQSGIQKINNMLTVVETMNPRTITQAERLDDWMARLMKVCKDKRKQCRDYIAKKESEDKI